MYPLKDLHTFHCEVYADSIIEIMDVSQLDELFQDHFFKNTNWMFLGGGSNVLFLKNYEGTILLNMLKGRDILGETSDGKTILKVASGELWHDTVLYSLRHGLNGLENLSLIPGTVGAAPMQNIGAYGVEFQEVFHSLQAFDIITGETRTFFKDECRFGYRDSIFKNEFKGQLIILSIQMHLKNDGYTNVDYGDIIKTLDGLGIEGPYLPGQISDAIISIRKSKLPDPDELGNAGSFFKNPIISIDHYNKLKIEFPDLPGYPVNNESIKVPAGWLIEQCGFKGKRIGDAGSHAKQALVLVNYGNATGEEILELAEEIQLAVSEKFEINICPEVNIVG